jgi:hypothetical protein
LNPQGFPHMLLRHTRMPVPPPPQNQFKYILGLGLCQIKELRLNYFTDIILFQKKLRRKYVL